MSRHPKLEEFQIESKPSRFQGVRSGSEFFSRKHSHFLDKNASKGRSLKSCGKLILFYLVFYTSLMLLFTICMTTFHQQFINPRVPRLQQEYSLIGASPGLGFRPLPPDVRSTLIWYKGTGYDSYKYWEDELKDFLSVYKQKGQTAGAGQNIFNCNWNRSPPPGKVCDVDIRSGYEPCIEENHFSFHKSSPCIFLKLNKIYGWRPEFYEPHGLPEDMPTDLQQHIRSLSSANNHTNMVWVSCQGETPADRENIGPVKYLPHRGFPGYFYPYENAEGYLSPLVALHLERPRSEYFYPYENAEGYLSPLVALHLERPRSEYFYPYENAEGYLSPLVALHLERPRSEYFYPYENAEGYLSPLVALHLERPRSEYFYPYENAEGYLSPLVALHLERPRSEYFYPYENAEGYLSPLVALHLERPRSKYFYPYENAEGYLSPLVALHLERPRSKYFYPYENAEGYLSPLVALHLERPRSKYFYPYENAEGYLSPLVALHLERPRSEYFYTYENAEGYLSPLVALHLERPRSEYFYTYENAEGYLSPLVALHLERPRSEYFYTYENAEGYLSPLVALHLERPRSEYFYTYENAEGYLSPLVALHLERPRTGIVINIECRAWAKNIIYNRKERQGIVHFEIMIE